MSTTPDLAEKLQGLRDYYLEQLPAKLADLDQTLTRLNRNGGDADALSELHRKAHSLSGSGATYGFNEISRAAHDLELCVKAQIEPGVGLAAASWPEIQRLFAVLRTHMENPTQTGSFALSTDTADSRAASGDTHLLYLLDDDVESAKLLAGQLSNYGYEVRIFLEPQPLFDAINTTLPAALLFDITLAAGARGPETARLLPPEIRERVPIIFMSVHTDIDSRLDAVRAGAAAYLTKPVNIDAAVEELDRLTHRIAPEPFRVLVVDDSFSVAALYAATLDNVGMLTRIVTHPKEALNAIQDFNPELILMDMYMPEIRGDELAKIVRQHPALLSIPIVFLSAETDENKQMAAMQQGGDDFLTKPINLQHLVSSVTARVQRYRVLRGFMQRDSLTGLLNHTKSKEFLETELARAARNKQPITFAMIDIDHFKQVNDSYGHPMGDLVIKSLARLLQQRLRKSDIVGRYGGEEFAAIMPNTTTEQAAAVLDTLRVAFSKIMHQIGPQTFSCTFSSGLAQALPGEYGSDMVGRADRALYEAKHGGRDRVATA